LSPSSVATLAGAGDVLVHPSGLYLFTLGQTSDSLQVFNLNLATGALTPNSTFSFPAGTRPLSLALNQAGEYLFTKSEGDSSGQPQTCVVHDFKLNIISGGLTHLSPFSTGMSNSGAYHGMSTNPVKPWVYATLMTSTGDYMLLPLASDGTLLAGTPFKPFGATGSDQLTISRNGKWGFLTDLYGDQIAIGTLDPITGALTSPALVPLGGTGLFPVSVTVVGTVQ